MPISKEDLLTHQSGNPWLQSEDHSRIPITWPCRSWVGNSFRIIPRAILKGYTSFSIICQGIKHFNTPWTPQLVYTGGNQSTCMYLTQLGQFILHCGNSVTVQISRWPDLY
ncbi:hypothetical protein O181_045884 [Austropuccinia psidii MF-1]|uniref:Uncharacterized protein n=1 Tax=Austropuccinia psidii MF-1 TaxID=1389203 RepID=A0A9Q3HKR9_9BASI|nr:hypothetical protein [Austropuccinia psidii MF-1]